MTVSAGSRLSPYEILAPLGAGGMGEVYRARDNEAGSPTADSLRLLGSPLSSASPSRP